MDNYGDEMLLKSFIKMCRESSVEEIHLLFPKSGSRKISGIKIIHINKNSVISILKSVRSCDVVIGGGGGIFQDETSSKSFFYYDFIVSSALLFKKPVFLFGQGLGRVSSKYNCFRLKKILSNPLCTGYFRDEVSYRYSKRFSKNHFRGTDLSYGYLHNRERMKTVPGRLGLITKSLWPESVSMIKALKNEGINEIFIFVLFPGEELKNSVKIAKDISGCVNWVRESEKLDVSVKVGEVNEITDLISSCSLVISERLHGAIVASHFGIPFLTKDSFKTRAFFRDFKDYNSFFKDKGPSEIGNALSFLKKIDFSTKNREFVQKNNVKFVQMEIWLENTLNKF